MPSHPEDLALVARIVGGDETAADEFAREYLPRFTHLARRNGVPGQDCEDVAQEVFLAAFSQMQRGLFRGDSSLGTWLDRILHGKIADYWRGRPKEIADTDAEERSTYDGGDRQGPIGKHLEKAPDQSLVLSVREALHAMPAPYRAILLLNRSAGYTLAEIAHALHLTIGQVSRRLYTSENLFRKVFRSDGSRPRRGLLQAVRE